MLPVEINSWGGIISDNRRWEERTIRMDIDSHEGKLFHDSCRFMNSLAPTPEGMRKVGGSWIFRNQYSVLEGTFRYEEIPLSL